MSKGYVPIYEQHHEAFPRILNKLRDSDRSDRAYKESKKRDFSNHVEAVLKDGFNSVFHTPVVSMAISEKKDKDGWKISGGKPHKYTESITAGTVNPFGIVVK